MKAWGKQNPKYAGKTPEQICEDEEAKKEILKTLAAYGKQNDLKGFEQIKSIHLTMEEYTVENDMLTPTFKLKREVAAKVYRPQIDAMYKALSNGRAFN